MYVFEKFCRPQNTCFSETARNYSKWSLPLTCQKLRNCIHETRTQLIPISVETFVYQFPTYLLSGYFVFGNREAVSVRFYKVHATESATGMP